MSVAQLDAIFPYLCFAYGAIMTLALNSKHLERLACERIPEPIRTRFRSHRGLAFACLWLGGAWILQNLWLA